jgi:hypothetical protein
MPAMTGQGLQAGRYGGPQRGEECGVQSAAGYSLI